MKRKIFYILVLLILPLFICCIDDPVQQNNNKIKGRVIGGLHPLVSINNGPIVDCEIWGGFEAEAPVKPYNILVTDREVFYFNWLTTKYNGITINNPNLFYATYISVYNYSHNDSSYQMSGLLVRFPQLTEKKFAVTKFISENNFYQSRGFVYGNPGTYYINSEVYFPKTNSSITGKIYYLEYNIDTIPGSVIHYDKFGIKDITLIKGQMNETIFENSDLYDPIDYEMNISYNYPPEISSRNLLILLTNSTINNNSDFELADIDNGSIIVPLLPSKDFKIKTISVYYNNLFPNSTGVSTHITAPGKPLIINYTETTELISPPDGAENVTTASYLEIRDNAGPAIYEFNLSCAGKFFQLYTNKQTVQLADFEAWNFELPKNSYYKWAVRKFRNYNSIDEFVSNEYYFGNRSDYIEVNKGRSFKTAP